MNYLRNNNTGAVYNFDSAPQGPALDYSNPIDIGGVKAYRLQSDPFTAVLPDGRKVQFGVDKAATDAANKSALDMQHARLGNKLLETQIMAAAQREAPTLQHVETPNGPMAFNPKTGQYTAIGGAGDQPMQSKEQAQRTQDANAVMELTDQAAPLFDKAPGSHVGMALNMLGRTVGADTEATKAQAQLDVLAGSLIAKMPKMSGPQSDKDILLYRAMAGNLNDPTLPATAKKAAMDTLRSLNEKYATGYKAKQAVQQPSGLRAGSVEDGHMYLGGDPSNPSSWKRVQ